MSRFDLYRTSIDDELLLDLQTDLLDIQTTRMVAPVLPQHKAATRIKFLHPIIDLDGEPYVLATHLMGAVPTIALNHFVANLSNQADDFTRALDLLFQGY